MTLGYQKSNCNEKKVSENWKNIKWDGNKESRKDTPLKCPVCNKYTLEINRQGKKCINSKCSYWYCY